MLMAISAAFSTLMNSTLVNWLPWRRMAARTGGATMLHVEDVWPAMAGQSLLQRLDARQSAYSVINSRQARTLRQNQSTTAARVTNPRDIGT